MWLMTNLNTTVDKLNPFLSFRAKDRFKITNIRYFLNVFMTLLNLLNSYITDSRSFLIIYVIIDV